MFCLVEMYIFHHELEGDLVFPVIFFEGKAEVEGGAAQELLQFVPPVEGDAAKGIGIALFDYYSKVVALQAACAASIGYAPGQKNRRWIAGAKGAKLP